MVSDCGPLNRCGAMYIGFMLTLVSVGFYDIGVLVFLQVCGGLRGRGGGGSQRHIRTSYHPYTLPYVMLC